MPPYAQPKYTAANIGKLTYPAPTPYKPVPVKITPQTKFTLVSGGGGGGSPAPVPIKEQPQTLVKQTSTGKTYYYDTGTNTLTVNGQKYSVAQDKAGAMAEQITKPATSAPAPSPLIRAVGQEQGVTVAQAVAAGNIATVRAKISTGEISSSQGTKLIAAIKEKNKVTERLAVPEYVAPMTNKEKIQLAFTRRNRQYEEKVPMLAAGLVGPFGGFGVSAAKGIASKLVSKAIPVAKGATQAATKAVLSPAGRIAIQTGGALAAPTVAKEGAKKATLNAEEKRFYNSLGDIRQMGVTSAEQEANIFGVGKGFIGFIPGVQFTGREAYIKTTKEKMIERGISESEAKRLSVKFADIDITAASVGEALGMASISTASETLGQTLISKTVGKGVETTVKGAERFLFTKAAPRILVAGAYEGGTSQVMQDIARGKPLSFEKTTFSTVFGAVSAGTIGFGISLGALPKGAAKQIAVGQKGIRQKATEIIYSPFTNPKFQKAFRAGTYLTDPYEYAGDVAAAKIARALGEPELVFKIRPISPAVVASFTGVQTPAQTETKVKESIKNMERIFQVGVPTTTEVPAKVPTPAFIENIINITATPRPVVPVKPTVPPPTIYDIPPTEPIYIEEPGVNISEPTEVPISIPVETTTPVNVATAQLYPFRGMFLPPLPFPPLGTSGKGQTGRKGLKYYNELGAAFTALGFVGNPFKVKKGKASKAKSGMPKFGTLKAPNLNNLFSTGRRTAARTKTSTRNFFGNIGGYYTKGGYDIIGKNVPKPTIKAIKFFQIKPRPVTINNGRPKSTAKMFRNIFPKPQRKPNFNSIWGFAPKRRFR